MNFPRFISFTVTNSCNLRCRMCGQLSDEGYVLNRTIDTRSRMKPLSVCHRCGDKYIAEIKE